MCSVRTGSERQALAWSLAAREGKRTAGSVAEKCRGRVEPLIRADLSERMIAPDFYQRATLLPPLIAADAPVSLLSLMKNRAIHLMRSPDSPCSSTRLATDLTLDFISIAHKIQTLICWVAASASEW